jgi:eukaryotic-like serine/threonine-protein kinase
MLLAGVGLAAAVAVALVVDDGDRLPGGSAHTAGPVKLAGVGAYDPPPGDGREHDEDAPNATDGNLATYWSTESYQSFSATKSGVGLVLDAGKSVELSRVRVQTDTPGFTAEIQAGGSSSGPFHGVSSSETVGTSADFAVHGSARYWVVWITALEGRAHVNEVTASG